jgi:hypothetical protein
VKTCSAALAVLLLITPCFAEINRAIQTESGLVTGVIGRDAGVTVVRLLRCDVLELSTARTQICFLCHPVQRSFSWMRATHVASFSKLQPVSAPITRSLVRSRSTETT